MPGVESVEYRVTGGVYELQISTTGGQANEPIEVDRDRVRIDLVNDSAEYMSLAEPSPAKRMKRES